MESQIEDQILIVSEEGDRHKVLFKNSNVLVTVNKHLLNTWLEGVDHRNN